MLKSVIKFFLVYCNNINFFLYITFIAINVACTTHTLTRNSMPNKLFFLCFTCQQDLANVYFSKKCLLNIGQTPLNS